MVLLFEQDTRNLIYRSVAIMVGTIYCCPKIIFHYSTKLLPYPTYYSNIRNSKLLILSNVAHLNNILLFSFTYPYTWNTHPQPLPLVHRYNDAMLGYTEL